MYMWYVRILHGFFNEVAGVEERGVRRRPLSNPEGLQSSVPYTACVRPLSR